MLAPWSKTAPLCLKDSLSCKLSTHSLPKQSWHCTAWCNARSANTPCQKSPHEMWNVTLFSFCTEQTAELNQLASPVCSLKLWSILLLLSNCFANEAHPGIVSKSLYYMCSFLQAFVFEPSSFCMHMHRTALSSHGGLDKHARLGIR